MSGVVVVPEPLPEPEEDEEDEPPELQPEASRATARRKVAASADLTLVS